MAQMLQLDAAAALVGKSEVTLRRLIKSGKIPVHKQKTLTGFIYLVDADHVKGYYRGKGETEFKEQPVAEEVPVTAAPQSHGRRLAVSDETGDATAYWQKRAENYEDRYHQEVQKHAAAREELGVWRGRAEHAQAMLLKMLPAAPEVISSTSSVPQNAPAAPKPHRQEANFSTTFLLVTTSVAFLALAAAVIYVTLTR